VESFNARLRDELLNGEIFYSLREAQVVIESWRRHYNTVRPHASLGFRPPAPEVVLPAFAAGPRRCAEWRRPPHKPWRPGPCCTNIQCGPLGGGRSPLHHAAAIVVVISTSPERNQELRCLARRRLVKFAPQANRTSGPKAFAAVGPTKYRPGTEDSKVRDSTGV
jgi:putative transposase